MLFVSVILLPKQTPQLSLFAFGIKGPMFFFLNLRLFSLGHGKGSTITYVKIVLLCSRTLLSTPKCNLYVCLEHFGSVRNDCQALMRVKGVKLDPFPP